MNLYSETTQNLIKQISTKDAPIGIILESITCSIAAELLHYCSKHNMLYNFDITVLQIKDIVHVCIEKLVQSGDMTFIQQNLYHKYYYNLIFFVSMKMDRYDILKYLKEKPSNPCEYICDQMYCYSYEKNNFEMFKFLSNNFANLSSDYTRKLLSDLCESGNIEFLKLFVNGLNVIPLRLIELHCFETIRDGKYDIFQVFYKKDLGIDINILRMRCIMLNRKEVVEYLKSISLIDGEIGDFLYYD